ncbi:uncharacterized protein Pyn_39359 [Prunus yedoensis var. nudiflora]|uniref:Uncharacterized protein n=1 Tax=Prunus yedoensis var. nudiflora TaxID=2094558 RepID=A0A314XV30_PRUYE|nr:uncharacterized protein Pyn_39359 [Prunus yedoensis var. nudiflora]
MLENSSSFGSTSSSPSLANLPPIRVHVEDGGGGGGGGGIRVQDQKMGIEEQFAQMTVGGGGQKQDEGSFVVLSPPPPMAIRLYRGLRCAAEFGHRVLESCCVGRRAIGSRRAGWR